MTPARRLIHTRTFRRSCLSAMAATALGGVVVLSGVIGPSVASAAQPTVGLGTATPYAVLAGSTITNTGPSVISGDLGLSPGTAVTGFPPGLVINGTEQVTTAAALQAQNDLTTAYVDAAGRTPASVVTADLGGQTLTPGVYESASSMGLTGTVTLDAQGNPAAVFIFQAGSTLTTASNSTVSLIGGADPCNVFWQVGSSATLGTDTTFVGSILALTSASLLTGTTVSGRVLARNGAVTLDTNTITEPGCATTATATATTTATTAPATAVTAPTAAPATTAAASGTPSTKALTVTGTGAIVPSGAPATGEGGASHAHNDLLVALGGVLLVGAGAALTQTYRRRRSAG